MVSPLGLLNGRSGRRAAAARPTERDSARGPSEPRALPVSPAAGYSEFAVAAALFLTAAGSGAKSSAAPNFWPSPIAYLTNLAISSFFEDPFGTIAYVKVQIGYAFGNFFEGLTMCISLFA